MRITSIDTYPDELDGVALASPRATFYHSSAWIRSVAAAYPRLRFRCLVAEDAGRIIGFFPFFVVRRGPLRALWSLPFGTYGGPVVEAGATAEAELLSEYARIADRPGVIEAGWVDFSIIGPESNRVSVTHVVDIGVGYDDLLASWPPQRRQRARRAERLGVAVAESSADSDRAAFMDMFEEKIAGFGGDNLYPRRLYDQLFQRGGRSVRLHVAHHEGEVVGALLTFWFKKAVIAWYNIVPDRHRKLQAGTLLYAECMRAACGEGAGVFNLGGSLGRESLIAYKESLGGVPHRFPVHVRRSSLGRIVTAVRGVFGARRHDA